MTPEQMQRIIEGAIMAAGEPISIDQLQKIFAPETPATAQIKEILQAIAQAYAETALELKEVASGYRFQVRQDLAPWIGKLWEEKPPRYSRALLETLALIAYRQPITRAEIEEVRGVAVSPGIMKTLSDREWIKIVGHRDVPGKPALFATTKKFLDDFNVKSLDQLPTLEQIKALDMFEDAIELQQLPLNVPQLEVTISDSEETSTTI